MNDYLVKSDVSSPVQVESKPTMGAPAADNTSRTTELEKGMATQMNTRETTPSLTLGTMNG
jgi:hypothetical protein